MRPKLILSLVLVSTAMASMGPGSTRCAGLSSAHAGVAAPAAAGVLEHRVGDAGWPSAGATVAGESRREPCSKPTPSQRAVAGLANPFDGGTRPGASGLRAPANRPMQPAPTASGQGFDQRLRYDRREVARRAIPLTATSPARRTALLQMASPQTGRVPQVPPGKMPGVAGPAAPGAIARGRALGGCSTRGARRGRHARGLPSATEGGAAPSGTAALAAEAFAEAGTGTGAGFGGTLEAGAAPFAMIGDISPLSTHAQAVEPAGPPPPPGQRGGSPIYPSVRNFKISENQSPRPQDRVFFNFNYYNNLNDTINRRDLSPVTQMKAYVYNFGIEKTFNNGMGSVGIELPLDNLTANSFGNVVSTPTSSALGNLTIFSKYILAQNVRTGSLISACCAITPQTGTSRFAGARISSRSIPPTFQTCLGYIYNYNNWYFQGFSGFSFSINPNDVSMIYNDIGVGYFLYRNQDSRGLLTALAPTVELHVNNPLNHRDPFNKFDLAGSPDTVDFTFGLNFGLMNTAVLTAAFVTPVASPKAFDSEAVLMLNIFYGRTRRAG